VLLVGLYLLLCVLYWAWSALQLAAELRDVLDVKHFINNKLGISDRQVTANRQRHCCACGCDDAGAKHGTVCTCSCEPVQLLVLNIPSLACFP
jgi:hypothetical protein